MSLHKDMQKAIHEHMASSGEICCIKLCSVLGGKVSLQECKAGLYTYRQLFPQNVLAKSGAHRLRATKRGFGRKRSASVEVAKGKFTESCKFQGLRFTEHDVNVIFGVNKVN